MNQANIDPKSFIKGLWSCVKGLCLFIFGYLPFGVLSAYLVILILDKGYEPGPMHLAFVAICIWLLGGVSFITLLILEMSQNKNQDSMFRKIGFSLSGISVCIAIVYTIVIFVNL